MLRILEPEPTKKKDPDLKKIFRIHNTGKALAVWSPEIGVDVLVSPEEGPGPERLAAGGAGVLRLHVPALRVLLEYSGYSAADPVSGYWAGIPNYKIWIRLPVLRSRIRICIVLGSCVRIRIKVETWIQIRIRIKVKGRIRIRIKLKRWKP